MSLTTSVWAILFPAAASLFWPRLRVLSMGLLGAAYLLALMAGLLDWDAIIAVALLLAAAYAIAPQRARPLRIAGHVMFAAIALVLGLHLMPGFHNLRVFGPAPLTPDAVPYTMYLNLDKPLAGFWPLLVWPAVCLRRELGAGYAAC